MAYDVYTTPHTEGEPTTYHARRISRTMDSHSLREHIEKTSLIDASIYELVLEKLKKEIPEQLLNGYDVHIQGLGTFYMKIGAKHQGYTDPKAITARELKIDGIGFRADKEFNERLFSEPVYFQREQLQQSEHIDKSWMIVELTDYCRQHGYFTVHIMMKLFHLTKYKASLLANQLVGTPTSKFTRHKEGNTYIYKRVGV